MGLAAEGPWPSGSPCFPTFPCRTHTQVQQLRGCRLGHSTEERWHRSLQVAPCAWGCPRMPHRLGTGMGSKPLRAAGQPHQQSISKLPSSFKPNTSPQSYSGFHQPQQVQKKLQIDVGKHDLQWMKTEQRKYFHEAAGFSCASHQGMCCPLSGIQRRTCWKQ